MITKKLKNYFHLLFKFTIIINFKNTMFAQDENKYIISKEPKTKKIRIYTDNHPIHPPTHPTPTLSPQEKEEEKRLFIKYCSPSNSYDIKKSTILDILEIDDCKNKNICNEIINRENNY